MSRNEERLVRAQNLINIHIIRKSFRHCHHGALDLFLAENSLNYLKNGMLAADKFVVITVMINL